MLFLDEIRKVSKETPVPGDSKYRFKKVFKKKQRYSADEDKHNKAVKKFFGRIYRIDEMV